MSGARDEHADAATKHRAAEPHARRILADGEPWIVREVPAPVFDRRGGTHLVFESPTIMRRVRNFAPGWHLLDDESLYELSLKPRWM